MFLKNEFIMNYYYTLYELVEAPDLHFVATFCPRLNQSLLDVFLAAELKGGRNIHFSPVLGEKWICLTTFAKYA